MNPTRVLTLLLTILAAIFVFGCAKVHLPQTVLGEWWEEKSAQGSLRQVLRFEQQAERALVYVGKAAEIGQEPSEWSAPYDIKRAGDGWSFRLDERDVVITLKADGKLSVTGLLVTVVGMKVKEDGSLAPTTDDSKPIETVFANLAAYRKVTMWFSLDDGDGDRFTFIGPTRNPQVQLRKNQVEIRWCFGNINMIDRQVSDLRLADFVDPKNANNRNPFGDRSDAANRIDLGTAAPNAEVCSQYLSVVQDGVFDYTVTATVHSPQGKNKTVTNRNVLSIAP